MIIDVGKSQLSTISVKLSTIIFIAIVYLNKNDYNNKQYSLDSTTDRIGNNRHKNNYKQELSKISYTEGNYLI